MERFLSLKSIFIFLLLIPFLAKAEKYSADELLTALYRGDYLELGEPPTALNPYWRSLYKIHQTLSQSEVLQEEYKNEVTRLIPAENEQLPYELRLFEEEYDPVDLISAISFGIISSGTSNLDFLVQMLNENSDSLSQRSLISAYLLNQFGLDSSVQQFIRSTGMCYADGAPFDAALATNLKRQVTHLRNIPRAARKPNSIVQYCDPHRYLNVAESQQAYLVSMLPKKVLIDNVECQDWLLIRKNSFDPITRNSVYRGLSRAGYFSDTNIFLNSLKRESMAELKRYLVRNLWLLNANQLIKMAQLILEQETDLGVHRSVNALISRVLKGEHRISSAELLLPTPPQYLREFRTVGNLELSTEFREQFYRWAEDPTTSLQLEGRRAMLGHFESDRNSIMDLRKARFLVNDPKPQELFVRMGFFTEPTLLPVFKLLRPLAQTNYERENFENIFSVLEKSATGEWQPSKVCQEKIPKCLLEAAGINYLKQAHLSSLSEANKLLSVAIDPLSNGFKIITDNFISDKITIENPSHKTEEWFYSEKFGWIIPKLS